MNQLDLASAAAGPDGPRARRDRYHLADDPIMEAAIESRRLRTAARAHLYAQRGPVDLFKCSTCNADTAAAGSLIDGRPYCPTHTPKQGHEPR